MEKETPGCGSFPAGMANAMINGAMGDSMENWISPWDRLRQPAPASGQFRGIALERHPSQIDRCVQKRGFAMPPPLDEAERLGLRADHERWGADASSLESIERLGKPNARVVVTGQQPGLMAGPLLVLYKTLGAVLLARDLKQRHPGLDFVPVFWVAGEDHDFDEVRRVYWPSHEGELQEYLLREELWQPGSMVGGLPTGAALPSLIEQIRSSTNPTGHATEVFDLLNAAYAGEGTLQDGFCRILLRLLRGMGLVIVSPLMDWVRRRSLPVFERELDRPGWSTQVVIERGEAIRAEGGQPALHRHAGAINLFWIDGRERRHALRLDQGRIVRALAGENESAGRHLPPLEIDTLRDMLAAGPSRFSSNVVTRPLVQDSILPTVAQMIGPGEAAYLAQVEGVYEAFGVFAPVRFPRPQVALLEPRVSRRLEKYRLATDEAMQLDARDLGERVLRRSGENHALDAIGELRERQLNELKALQGKLDAGDAVASGFDKLRQAMERGYGKIGERLVQQQSRDAQSLRKAMVLIANSLRPAGQWQERALNPLVPFALNYGLDWAQEISGRIDIDPAADMQVIALAELRS